MHPGMGKPQLLIIPQNEAPAQPQRDSPPSGLHPGRRSARPHSAGALRSGCGNRSPRDGGDGKVSSPLITVSAHQRSHCQHSFNHRKSKRIPEKYLLLLHSLVAQRVKHLPAMWKTRVWEMGQEDPLEKEMATHSNILAWRIPWT